MLYISTLASVLSVVQVWPEEDFPLQPVGTMTLNKNIDNFHNESEQIAFSPAVTIGGQQTPQTWHRNVCYGAMSDAGCPAKAVAENKLCPVPWWGLLA